MDGQRFDQIARVLAMGTSRRRLLTGVAGGSISALLTLPGAATAGADRACRGEGHACGGNQTCCDGLICTDGGAGGAPRCTACPPGLKVCGNVCAACCSDGDCPGDTCSTGACANGTCTTTSIAGCCTTNDQCNDNNPCTIDICDGGTHRCTYANDDGITCTTNGQTGACGNGACVAASPPQCNPALCAQPDNPCLAAACVGGACSIVQAAPNAPCSTASGASGTCQNGVCVAITPPQCQGPGDCTLPTTSCQVASCTGGQCGFSNANENGSCTTVDNQPGTCAAGQCNPVCTASAPVACTDASGAVHCCASGETCLGNTGQCCAPGATVCKDASGDPASCCIGFCPPAAPSICCPTDGGIVCKNSSGDITACCASNQTCINGACV